nr:TPA_asm: ND1 [Baikalogammarus pullus]
MDLFSYTGTYLVLVVMVLISVAFVTLMEQKILASSQIRLGPNQVGWAGVAQPFADAVKLLSKEPYTSRAMARLVYYISPIMALSVMLVLWALYPLEGGGLNLVYGILFFMSISGLSVYPVLAAGWSSNCKYSTLGGLRAVAQMVSYEVSMGVVLLGLIWLSGGFSVFWLMKGQKLVWNIFLVAPLGYVWFLAMLAETNRSPFDFAEGESELVSGFNTEYSSAGFTLIFMAEYGSILLMSLVFVSMFLGVSFKSVLAFKIVLVSFWFVWVRASLPRYRYDMLMGLAWKSLLPVGLFVFLYCASIGSLSMSC